ncbi:MAG: NAD(P)-dependent oxidoreductase [Candidatus Falkowbacteria bacterium]
MKKIKKILIFGAQGMLGQEFTNYLKCDKTYDVITSDKATIDITKFNQTLKIIKKIKPDAIINCAAIVNVDYCEKNPIAAFKVNTIGAGNIVSALNELNLLKTVVLHISTSDVFGNNNKKIRAENDDPVPVNIYGWSKLGGEKIVAAEATNKKIKYFIIRTSWIYSEYKDTFIDFVVKSLKNKKFVSIISDQYNTITWANDLAKAGEKLIKASHKYKSGIYHITGRSKVKLSKYNIALKIAEQLRLDKKYLKKGFKKDILGATRPDYAILASSKSINLPDWQASLSKYLNLRYGK